MGCEESGGEMEVGGLEEEERRRVLGIGFSERR